LTGSPGSGFDNGRFDWRPDRRQFFAASSGMTSSGSCLVKWLPMDFWQKDQYREMPDKLFVVVKGCFLLI
jgi:hypothetical protein